MPLHEYFKPLSKYTDLHHKNLNASQNACLSGTHANTQTNRLNTHLNNQTTHIHTCKPFCVLYFQLSELVN